MSTLQHQFLKQGRAGQGRAGQGRAGQGRAGQGRAGQGAKHAYTDEAREFEYSRLASIWLLFIC